MADKQAENKIAIEVVFANPSKQILIHLQVAKNTTVFQAIHASKILEQCPEIDGLQNRVGIFGKKVNLDAVLEEGDRVEIYDYLPHDPKQSRKVRAKVQGFSSMRTTRSPLKNSVTLLSTIGHPLPGLKE